MASPQTPDARRAPGAEGVVIESDEADDAALARQLIELVRKLALTLHPQHTGAGRVSLDSDLDRDLGFDSLSRVELVSRIERSFHARLPETLVLEATTPRDLLRALTGPERAAAPAAQAGMQLGTVQTMPREIGTLIDALEWHTHQHADRPHIVLDDGSAPTGTITYRGLRDASRRMASGLRRLGLTPRDKAVLMLPTGADYFFAFFGVLYAGGTPVPIYPPFRPAQLADHLQRHAGIMANAEAAWLITDEALRGVAAMVSRLDARPCKVLSVADVLTAAGDESPAHPQPQDVALLQYTSGSTGNPKGVVLTHANLLANIRAMGEALQVSCDDKVVSWLPLYHDMGLIGAWLGSLCFAMPAAIMPPSAFLAHPRNWLWALHRHRATITTAPNFAYEMCLRQLEAADLEGLDLSSVRLMLNGAEAVSPQTVRAFVDRYAAYGLRATALTPVYGLAECSVGLAFPPLDRGPVIDRVQRDPMTNEGLARPATPHDPNALEFVDCGHALPAHEIRIVDLLGRELEDRHEGRLQFRGPSATSGYYRNAEKTKELFDGDWLESGDRAYSVGGDIFITGRSKDLIIRAGRHLYPEELERLASDTPGVRKGCVAAFGIGDVEAGTERVVILAETRETDAAARAQISQAVSSRLAALIGAPADEVLLVPPHTVLKTSSGKVRRAACRELYRNHLAARRHAAMAVPGLQAVVGTWRLRTRLAAQLVASVLYAGYWWFVVGVFASLAWLTVAALPSRRWRWRVCGGLARGCLRTLGLPLSTEGGDHLPAGGAVIAVNHASYLDGVVLCAALAHPVVFVVKHELATQFFAGTFLRRIGALFVEREELSKSLAAQDIAVAALKRGEQLVFFPEGTLTRTPGLRAFRMGAFLAAAGTGAPVVPVALRGTRMVLRGDQWFPRRGRVQMTVFEPVFAEGKDWDAAASVRDKVRGKILAQIAEPDLS